MTSSVVAESHALGSARSCVESKAGVIMVVGLVNAMPDNVIDLR
jgi:hypothetical protein